jgi:hypothetical protein
MPTARAYLEGAAAYVVWMILYLYLKAGPVMILNYAESMGGDFVAEPVGWMRSIIQLWPLLGLVGLFVAMLAAGISARGPGGAPQMGLVKRAVVVAVFLTAISLYLAVIGGALAPMYGYARSIGAESTDFWWLLAKLKFLVTHLIPAILLAGPVVTWVYGVIREEKNEYAAVRP